MEIDGYRKNEARTRAFLTIRLFGRKELIVDPRATASIAILSIYNTWLCTKSSRGILFHRISSDGQKPPAEIFLQPITLVQKEGISNV